ncbi:HAMP domain-containing protein, partial [Agrobacterium vitis]|nr:HAMP domain-containing protein [Agrobacterium vitis]
MIQGGKADVIADADQFQAFSPIAIGRTKTPWSVIVSVPRPVAMAEAISLDQALSQRGGSDIIFQAIVALIIAAGGIGAMWFVALSIAKPIRAMTASMGQLAGGETDIIIPGAGRADEIGAMADAVGVFRDNAVANRQLEQDATASRLTTETERRRTAEVDRLRAEAMAQATSGLADGLKHLANADLTFRLDQPFAPEFESLRADFNAAITQLREAMIAVTQASQSIDNGSLEISGSSDELSKRTEQQAASLEETAAALDQITANVGNSSKRAEEARTVAV